MTNERAIELLKRISDAQFDGIHGDERREALEMAVSALEQNLVQESGDLVQDLVKDCISRQQAIEAFEPEHHTDWYTPTIIETLEALPSAQPTTTWLGSYSPYTCKHCGFHVDSKTRYCPECGRKASNYEV